MIAQRFESQLLAGPPARDPVGVAQRLLAIQAQDWRGACLAIRARTSGLAAADIERCLTADRSLVVTWLNRGTLHLICSEDYWWLHALTTPRQFTANARRLAQEGVPPDEADRGVSTIERSLTEQGPLTRGQLRERLTAAGTRTEGQALAHLLLLASLRGVVVRGPMIGSEHAYVLADDWLGKPLAVDRSVALAELARRYMAGHGPADARDLARWAGVALSDARAGLRSIAAELESNADGLVDLTRRPRAVRRPAPRLLGAYDPVLLGWGSRNEILGSCEGAVVRGGVFRAFALVRGRAAALWKLADGHVVLEPLEPITPADARALESDARDVVRFLGFD
jgi:Winged helix DNA-binding domain